MLVIKLNKVKNFCVEILRFLYSICIWKSIPTIRYVERAFDPTIRYVERAFDHLNLPLACYIFLREISLSENIILLYIFKVFEGNLKNVCQKAIKKPSYTLLTVYFTFLTKYTSNVRMFRYHAIKMNEL